MLFSSEALVLKRTPLTNNDMLLTLFTKKAGKLSAVANGARHPKNRLSSGAHPFVYGQFFLSTGRSLPKVNNIDIEQSFYAIREDIVKLAYGAWFLELAEISIMEGQANHVLFELLKTCLKIMIEKKDQFDVLKMAYEWKLIKSIGLQPMLDQCALCGKDNEKSWYFSTVEGGVVCSDCAKTQKGIYKVGTTLPRIMSYLFEESMETIQKTKFHGDYVGKMEVLSNHYLRHHLDKGSFKSLSFLNGIRGTEIKKDNEK